jgi:hypothetical protein
LTYVDSDGDAIFLSNEDDLRTLYDTSGEGFTKVIINEISPEDSLKFSPLELKIDDSNNI